MPKQMFSKWSEIISAWNKDATLGTTSCRWSERNLFPAAPQKTTVGSPRPYLEDFRRVFVHSMANEFFVKEFACFARL